MGWARYLLFGDIGQQLDLMDHEASMGRMQRSLASRCGKDMEQDERLDALARETAELKLYLGGLMDLLVSRNLVSQDDLKQLAANVQAALAPPPVQPGPEPETSPTLTELQHAVERSQGRRPSR